VPELPEVEVIRRGLQAVLPGKVISAVTVFEARSFPDYCVSVEDRLTGAEIEAVSRRGKMLMFQLVARGGTSEFLLAHLRMTGQLIYRESEADNIAEANDPVVGDSATSSLSFAGGFPSQSLVSQLPDKTTRVIIEFSDNSHLYFNDQRKFGYLKLVTPEELETEDFLVRLGPEPLDSDFTWQKLRLALSGLKGSQSASHQSAGGRLPVRQSTTNIKAALLDQSKVAGIGNIYADESLFRAGIDPRRSVVSITPAEYRRLLAGIRECLVLSIESGGSTARNYVDSKGLRGEFLDLHAAVYGKSGEPCPRCGQPIIKIRLAGRGTHFCEHCQR